MTTQFTGSAAVPWVAVSAEDAEPGKWQVIRVLDGGAVEVLRDCHGVRRLFHHDDAWNEADQLNEGES